MARPRSFDETEVLCAAMQAFRADGYAGVSIRNLEQATGLRAGSLYNAYVDKDGLYQAALTHYVEGFVAQRIAAHAGPSATLDDLEEFFFSILRQPFADGHGCLVVNAAVEFGPARSIASNGVTKGLDLVQSGISSVLTRELGPDKAGVATARLMLLYQGILVEARAGRANATSENALRDEFDRLRQNRV